MELKFPEAWVPTVERTAQQLIGTTAYNGGNSVYSEQGLKSSNH